MKGFRKLFIGVILLLIIIFIGANTALANIHDTDKGRPYRVEVSRLTHFIEKNGAENAELSEYEYVTNIEKYSPDNTSFYTSESEYMIREINGEIYRFDYTIRDDEQKKTVLTVNIILSVISLSVILLMAFINFKIIKPFNTMRDLPYELSKGNLTMPVKESKNKFFGKFLWGIDMLRENIEDRKQKELDMHKEKKTLLLSLSHDIKTPLSAIKLYSRALSKGLYTDSQKQTEIAESINEKADEIEKYVTEIVSASREDFLHLEVNMGEFYLSDISEKISSYYKEKLSLVKTDFDISEYPDCLLSGDIDRAAEVLQNIMENAIKYGDGNRIEIRFSEEDGCILITVANSGCSLPETELAHIFDSFWRGSNTGNKNGNGLGLYICRQLMNRMNGEIFAEIKDGMMEVTAVFAKA